MSNNETAEDCVVYLVFGSALTLLFIGLKLDGVLDWSWWWVLSPIWIPALVTFVISAIFLATKNHKKLDRTKK